MIIVRLQGRLGNQMFQYALAKSLEETGKEVYIDSSMLKYDNNYNELGLFPCIDVSKYEASTIAVEQLGDCKKTFIHKLKRKLLGYKKTHVRENGYAYHPELLEMDNVYLEGYWQSDKYFKGIENQICKVYTFPELDEANQKYAQEIRTTNSISLHIRRGDYLSVKNAPMHGNICTKAYYDQAIAYMEKKVEKPCFYIFTDDAEWAREEYSGRENFTIVDINHGNQSYRDMQLMSLCKHNIIANSSFSWWGAWLNANPDKQVVAPGKWFNLADTPDIWCEGWKVMGDE